MHAAPSVLHEPQEKCKRVDGHKTLGRTETHKGVEKYVSSAVTILKVAETAGT